MTKFEPPPQYLGMARFVLIALLCSSRMAAAEDDCRGVDIEMTPSEKLQIVAWIEDTAGNYVDTAFITEATGLRGIGNRTGVMDLKSGPKWPYGSRDDVLPIWAHRHGIVFPAVIWQSDDQENGCNMSRPFGESSAESYFCRPIMPTEPMWDAGTCASQIFTDKGKFSDDRTSLYPPRADVVQQAGVDSPSVAEFAELNPFDTVSQATPPGDQAYRVTWVPASTVAPGDYLLRVEVSKEFDFNATYQESTYPTTQCAWLEYGKPYRGQPSVLYEVPFTLGATTATTSSLDYVGYSDLGGTLHAPDATITTDTPGSGASRLRVAIAPDSSTYRVRATTRIEQDNVAPSGAGAPAVTNIEPNSAELGFTAPGDDGDVGVVAGYDIRYRIGDTLDDASFETAERAGTVTPLGAGQRQTLALANLAPGTEYVIGIRAYDNCKHVGPLVTVRFATPTVDVGCGCRSSNPAGLGLVLLALLLRRRRR